MNPSSKQNLLPTQSLKFSVWDGVFWAIMFGCTEAYFGAFAVFLGGTELQISLLSTLPVLFGALSQVLAVRVLATGIQRKKLLTTTTSLQAVSCIVIGSIPFLFGTGPASVNVLIVCIVAYFMFGHFAVPLWVSLMGDLVPPEIKGRYFGLRNLRQGIALFLSLLTSAFFLERYKETGYGKEAFFIMFSIGFLGRSLSSYFLAKHDDPPIDLSPKNSFTFFQFLRQLPTSNFARFALFHALMHFSFTMAGSYFVVYMLRILEFSYSSYMFVIAACMASVFIMTRVWGGFCDRYGSKVMLELCCGGIALVPALWLFGTSLPYFLIVQLFAGFCFAGFQLGIMNFTLDAVTAGKRGRCTAYMWLLTAPCMILGSLTGRFLLGVYNPEGLAEGVIAPEAYLTLFLTSAVLRGLVAIIMLPGFKEVRAVEPWKHKRFIYRIAGVGFGEAKVDVAIGIFRNNRRKFDRSRFLKKDKHQG